MAKAKTIRKETPAITVHSGLAAKKRKYPFDDLKKPGDYFIVAGKDLEKSVRTQAYKNQSTRSVRYNVNRVKKGDVLSDKTRIKSDGVIVRFDSYITE